jgi:hypothetical protein
MKQIDLEYFRNQWLEQCNNGHAVVILHLKSEMGAILNQKTGRVVGGDDFSCGPGRRFHVEVTAVQPAQILRVLPHKLLFLIEMSYEQFLKIKNTALVPVARTLLRQCVEGALVVCRLDSMMSQRPDCVCRVNWLENDFLLALISGSRVELPKWECQAMGGAEALPEMQFLAGSRNVCFGDESVSLEQFGRGLEVSDQLQSKIEARLIEFVKHGFCECCQMNNWG